MRIKFSQEPKVVGQLLVRNQAGEGKEGCLGAKPLISPHHHYWICNQTMPPEISISKSGHGRQGIIPLFCLPKLSHFLPHKSVPKVCKIIPVHQPPSRVAQNLSACCICWWFPSPSPVALAWTHPCQLASNRDKSHVCLCRIAWLALAEAVKRRRYSQSMREAPHHFHISPLRLWIYSQHPRSGSSWTSTSWVESWDPYSGNHLRTVQHPGPRPWES